MTWPAWFLWIMLLGGLFSKGPLILYVGALCGALGSLQMVPGELVGGTNLLPGSVYTLLLLIKILVMQRPASLLHASMRLDRLGYLFIFYAWCLISAFVMPRLFLGQVDVIPIAAQVPWAVPLQPTTANITQPAYLSLSVFSCVAAFFSTRQPRFIKHWLQASAITGIFLIITGASDLFLSQIGQSALLDPFRNASYALLSDAEMNGTRRTIGLMPEASAYGGACVTAATGLLFLRPCFSITWRRYIVPATISGLIIMALISTSSAAYVALAVLVVCYTINWIRKSWSNVGFVKAELTAELIIVAGIVVCGLILVLLEPRLLDPFYELLDQVVFSKSSSASYEERNMWTQVGLGAFFGTYGLGAGFGSARVSNWFVAELSNAGAFGSLALFLFFRRILTTANRHLGSFKSELLVGLRFSTLPAFAVSALAGTTPDLIGAFGYGVLASLVSDCEFHRQTDQRGQLLSYPLIATASNVIERNVS